jgi:hypothetical protein
MAGTRPQRRTAFWAFAPFATISSGSRSIMDATSELSFPRSVLMPGPAGDLGLSRSIRRRIPANRRTR